MNYNSMAMQGVGPSGANQGVPKVSGYKTAQMPNFTPEMMQLFQSLLGPMSQGVGGGIDYLSKIAGGDEEAFGGMEQNAMNQFQKFLGQAGTRFSDLGAQDSSYFENAVSGAGSEMTQNLQAQKAQMRQQAIDSLLGNSQTLLAQKPYDNFALPNQQKQGFDWGSLAQSVVKTIPGVLNYFK